MNNSGQQVAGGGSPNPNMIGMNSPAGMTHVMSPMAAPGYAQHNTQQQSQQPMDQMMNKGPQ